MQFSVDWSSFVIRACTLDLIQNPAICTMKGFLSFPKEDMIANPNIDLEGSDPLFCLLEIRREISPRSRSKSKESEILGLRVVLSLLILRTQKRRKNFILVPLISQKAP